MEINGNLKNLSIESIHEAEAHLKNNRSLSINLGDAGLVRARKLTRAQAREIKALLNGSQLADLLMGIVSLSDKQGVVDLVEGLCNDAEGLLDRLLDYGTDFPGGLIAEGKENAGQPVRDHLPLDEQVLAAAAVLILNFSANKVYQLFSGGVSDAVNSDKELSTALSVSAPGESAA